jgi:hypothetical protein|uniref:Uncharacterized protein n=1 Tax=Caulobacter sp. (strain K31) TaxID=366602 RepID=B0T6R1_CAUSK
MARRQFQLPELDEAFLDTLGLAWETIEEGGVQWLLLPGHGLPDGFDRLVVDIAIQISAGYPAAMLDMAYFHPPIGTTSRRPIPNADVIQILDGREWQRWSRHRTAENPWVPGEDDLSSHIHYMDAWLVAEIERI